MANKSALAEDSQAMLKLDASIKEDDPYKELIGGASYVPIKNKSVEIADMFDVEEIEKNQKIRAGTVILIIVAIIIMLVTLGYIVYTIA